MNKLAFIGGTGVYDAGILSDIRSEIINTPLDKRLVKLGILRERNRIFSPAWYRAYYSSA